MRFGERLVLVLLVGALAIVLTWPRSPAHPNETEAQHVARIDRELAALEKQPNARCPADWGALATASPLRVGVFFGYANFDDHVLDAGFAHALVATLEKPCRGTLAACGFAVQSEETNHVALARKIDDRDVTLDVRWTSIGASEAGNRRNADRQKEQSRVVKEAFYAALRDDDVVLYTGHSRGGGGLGFDPSTPIEIGWNAVFRSPARAIRHALEARPSRLKLLGAMACESDDYYEKEFHAANPDASLLLVKGNISSVQTDQIDIGVLNAVLGERCKKERDASLRSVDEPAIDVRYIER